ncbi:MAG: 30S ribosomal protein S8 [Candidatus Dadabacteria bacterium]|nr:30S ribosomal protein S8 [Candidatus Dadabacteria bacterium]MYB26332.1 30S ribosomal protein S8 [Candidatus Dadabacteria bacterium]
MTDPIADMLTRIRNAFMAGHDQVEIPGSVIKGEIARVLTEEGYVESYKITEEGVKKTISIKLKYGPDGKAAVDEIKRISKPSRRVYVGKDDIPRVRGGMGISILSTSRGIMTGVAARSKSIGGEILCTVI